ncbi:MAG: VTT domain-containing protein [Candidatus Omnitrophota bacterium]
MISENGHAQIDVKKIPWFRYPSIWTRQLYLWMIHWADTPYGVPALFLIAVAESSCFPLPPDILLIALALSKPARAFFYALICSIGSVLGGLLGYALGFFFWNAVGNFFLTHIISPELFQTVCHKYQLYSFWIVFSAAFTPIPYKVFTITSGVSHVNIWGFLIASVIGRSMRFFLVAAILYFFGEAAKKFIEKHFEWITLVFTALLILGFVFIEKLI